MKQHWVAITGTGVACYPPAPFHPSERYPERLLSSSRAGSSGETNAVYAGVRRLLALLGLDVARYGTPCWNPLGDLIRPGARVLIKPNLVRHYHPYGLNPQSLVTHGSLVRAICDYALRAAGPHAEIVIADAPLQSCDFAAVLELAGLRALVDYYRAEGARIQVRDLRLVRTVAESGSRWGRVLVQHANPGDPAGYTHINLGSRSLHAARAAAGHRYRVTCYDPARMAAHHGRGRHEYVVANSLLEADVVINLPKMKTHHKAGITGALKNFIGINGHKDCLPHHVKGTPGDGGDEYRRASWKKQLDSWLVDQQETHGSVLVKKTLAAAHRVLHAVHMRESAASYWEGSWFGNDTISRTTVDLNRIVCYADRSGRLCATPQRTLFSLVDGVIAGEGDGPLAPTPRPAAVLLAGMNPVAVDLVMARLMGFRGTAIATLRHALDAAGPFPLADFGERAIEIRTDQERWQGIHPGEPGDSFRFKPHHGWRGEIEL
jgi:uncharacterized protein (DUF362 family)